jgi:hypothetical protein
MTSGYEKSESAANAECWEAGGGPLEFPIYAMPNFVRQHD